MSVRHDLAADGVWGGCQFFAVEDGSDGFVCSVGTNDYDTVMRRLDATEAQGRKVADAESDC